MPTLRRGLVNRDVPLPAADQARNNVAGGDGLRSLTCAPRARFGCITYLQLAHLSSPFGWFEETGLSGDGKINMYLDFVIIERTGILKFSGS